jgi:hypothetical protein
LFWVDLLIGLWGIGEKTWVNLGPRAVSFVFSRFSRHPRRFVPVQKTGRMRRWSAGFIDASSSLVHRITDGKIKNKLLMYR